MKSDFANYDRFIGNTDLCLRVQNVYLTSNISKDEIFAHLSIPCFLWVDGIHTTCFESNETTLLSARDYQNDTLVWTVIWERDGNKIKWTCSSEYETVMARSDDIAMGAFQHYMGVQILSTYRPACLVVSEKQVMVPKVEEKNGKKRISHYESKMVKVIRFNEEELSKRHNIITCPAWTVAGHWVHRKNGTVYWQRPCVKGKKRNDPNALVPKTYQIPNERQK